MPEPDYAAAARAALNAWDLDVASLEIVSHSENVVFAVTAQNGERFVFRLHRPGYHSLKELTSEQQWTAALRKEGIDVPVPRATRSGSLYGEASVAGVPCYAGMLEWVEGETMNSLMTTGQDRAGFLQRFESLGGLLATLHNQASSWKPPVDFQRRQLDAAGLMGAEPHWGPFWLARRLNTAQKNRFAALRERLHDILTRLDQSTDEYSLIHADLHPGNVVVGEGGRLHIIDFDDAAFGWHSYDLAVALKNYQEDPAFSAYQGALLKGYRRYRALREEQAALIPLFLLIRALASIGWADARPELGHPEYVPRLARDVETKAEATLAVFPG
ncbi:MAG: phosphotransferase [Pseudomonadota bacterium]